MTPTQKLIEAAEAAVECLESLQGGCTDSDDGTVEAITVYCPEVIEALRAALHGLREAQAEPVAGVHWYCLAATGTAMLCTDEEDARHEAAECDRLYPMHAPHRAVQLVPATPPTTDAPAQWRPIETAPKDCVREAGFNRYGKPVLVWSPQYKTPMRARWWRRTDSEASNFLVDGGWAVLPTHWMPLPAAPTQEGAPK